VIRLVAQHHRQLIGHKLSRVGTLKSPQAGTSSVSCLFSDPSIGVPHCRLGEPSQRSRSLSTCVGNRLVPSETVVLIFPRHAFIVAATTDSFRTCEQIASGGRDGIEPVRAAGMQPPEERGTHTD
jgi:hypothetical protein